MTELDVKAKRLEIRDKADEFAKAVMQRRQLIQQAQEELQRLDAELQKLQGQNALLDEIDPPKRNGKKEPGAVAKAVADDGILLVAPEVSANPEE